MAYRNYFRSVLNDNFKILTWVLILFIAITPNFIFIQSANAAKVGGWSLSNAVAQGASTVYDASKNVLINGKDFVKDSWVKITPNATQVAKVLARGGAGYALSVAVEQLIGAVDWVLDPANNQIKWQEDGTIGGTYIFLCTEHINGCPAGSSMINPTLVDPDVSFQWRDVCASQAAAMGGTVHSNSKSGTCIVTTSSGNTFYGIGTRTIEGEEGEEKTLPLPVVAERVISNAEAEDEHAQVATTAAAADIVAEAETDNTKARPIVNQAEANAETKPADEAAAEKANTGEGTATPEADPVTGEQAPPIDIALEFPVFCNWAPIVCEAAQTAVNFMSDFEPDAESGEVEIYQDNSIIFDDSQRINFSSSCPSPEQFTVSFFGTSQNLEFSYQPLCNFMSMIKPFVVAGSYVIGAYIVMGLSRGSAD